MNLNSLKQQNVNELLNLKQSGKKIVGVFCTYAPKELIYASGAWHHSCPQLTSMYDAKVTN